MLVACNPSIPPTPDAVVMGTALAQTDQARAALTQVVIPTNTPEPIPTETAEPTRTLRPTNSPIPTITSIITVPTITTVPTLDPGEHTLPSELSTQVYLDNYEQVNEIDFVTNPIKYENKLIKLSGFLLNILSDKEFQIFIKSAPKAFILISDAQYNDLEIGDDLTIYGKGAGEHCFKNQLGDQVCQPLVIEAVILK